LWASSQSQAADSPPFPLQLLSGLQASALGGAAHSGQTLGNPCPCGFRFWMRERLLRSFGDFVDVSGRNTKLIEKFIEDDEPNDLFEYFAMKCMAEAVLVDGR
jgi:hypothetical protein